MSDFIHFNPEIEYNRLFTELSKCDFGRVSYNITPGEDLYIRTSLSGKVFDYLTAGLPLAVCNTEILSELVDKLGCGKVIDFNGDIMEQCESIKRIIISEDFCVKNSLTMESNIGRLIAFYSDVIGVR